MDRKSKEMYQNIIYVIDYLCKLPKKQRKDIDVNEIHSVVSYIFNEYIKLKGINDKKEITEQMIKQVRSRSIYDEINQDIVKLPKEDIYVMMKYITETDNPGTLDGFNAFLKLQKMVDNSIVG